MACIGFQTRFDFVSSHSLCVLSVCWQHPADERKLLSGCDLCTSSIALPSRLVGTSYFLQIENQTGHTFKKDSRKCNNSNLAKNSWQSVLTQIRLLFYTYKTLFHS